MTRDDWGPVAREAERLSRTKIAALADADKDRFAHFSHALDGLLVDFSRQKLDAGALDALTGFAAARGFDDFRQRLFAGETVNETEQRPALHMAWRAGEGAAWPAAGPGIAKSVADERVRMRALADGIRSGAITGARGRPIRQILHLGIGGSDLGPRLIYDALKYQRDPLMTLRFAANIDAAELNDALEGLDPETTLIIIVSKSFTTPETLTNARHARFWLEQGLGAAEAAKSHLAAVSANPERAREFGVPADRIFGFQDWVGGRYSLWSSVSLSLEIALQAGAMDALRDGAAAMDAHFRDAPMADNIPLLKALTDLWNAQALRFPTRCVAPYATRLRLLPAFLQQLEMESNGKGVALDGSPVTASSPVVWGAEGSNAQHAFFQQLHQGPQGAPVDFLAVAESQEARGDMHRALLANCIAQGEALMRGRNAETVREEMQNAAAIAEDIARLTPHRVCPGDRPSTTFILDRLDAKTLGALLALYEHKTAAEGALMGVNSFDQYGVELGKTLAKRTLPALEGETDQGVDAISAALIAHLRS